MLMDGTGWLSLMKGGVTLSMEGRGFKVPMEGRQWIELPIVSME